MTALLDSPKQEQMTDIVKKSDLPQQPWRFMA